MSPSTVFLFVLGCALICPFSYEQVAAQDDAACLSEPWIATEVFLEEGSQLARGAGGECLAPVVRMTGDATLFDKRPGWSPGRVALAQHASGYYLRLVYQVPDEWGWYAVNTINPLVLGLEDGTELALYPACETRVSSAIFTGYYRVNSKQLVRLSQQRVAHVHQFMTKPADVDSEYLKQNDSGLSYFVLRLSEGQLAESLQKFARCMLGLTEATEDMAVVPPPVAASDDTETAKKGTYAKTVQGKLWLEGFAGPSSYDLDRFGYRYRSGLDEASADVDLAPRVKGPEFGGAIGGALFDQMFFIGGSYRQAKLEIGEGLGGFKLMKTGLDMQLVVTPAPYVHPLLRVGVGYARAYGGNFAAEGLVFNGFYFMLGVGVRIPVVRWVSVFGTFDWSFTEISPKGREADGNLYADGSQLGGTFGLTLHFIGVR